MSIAVLMVYTSVIVLWILAGRYEWRVPDSLCRRIQAYLCRQNKEVRESLELIIEAREFISADLEKEIYIVKKARSRRTDNVIMTVDISAETNISGQTDFARTKQRLEKRFPGLTINFTWEDEGNTHAVSCVD